MKPVDPNVAPRFGGPGGRPGAQGPAPALTGYYASEARSLADGTRSILDIHGAISTEFGPVPLERVVTYLRALEKAGTLTTTEKPATPAKKGATRR